MWYNVVYSYTGPVTCGIIEEPVPQLIAFGKTITTAMNFTFASKSMTVCVCV